MRHLAIQDWTSNAQCLRLQLHAPAYKPGNFLRALATPEPVKHWLVDEPQEEADQVAAEHVGLSNSPGSSGRVRLPALGVQ
jgi:hypothetical protein